MQSREVSNNLTLNWPYQGPPVPYLARKSPTICHRCCQVLCIDYACAGLKEINEGNYTNNSLKDAFGVIPNANIVTFSGTSRIIQCDMNSQI